MDAIQLFAKNFIATRFEDLPRDVVEVTKKEVLDVPGAALAGTASPGMKDIVDMVMDWGGKEESSVICRGRKFPRRWPPRRTPTWGTPLTSTTSMTWR